MVIGLPQVPFGQHRLLPSVDLQEESGLQPGGPSRNFAVPGVHRFLGATVAKRDSSIAPHSSYLRVLDLAVECLCPECNLGPFVLAPACSFRPFVF